MECDSRSGGLTRERYLTSQNTSPIASAWEPLRWAKRRSSRAARKTLTGQIPNFGHWATKHPGGRSGERKREHAKMAQAASSNRARAPSVVWGRKAHVPRMARPKAQEQTASSMVDPERFPDRAQTVRVSNPHTRELSKSVDKPKRIYPVLAANPTTFRNV